MCIRFKGEGKEGNVSPSKGCSELLYFTLLPSTPGALPGLLWTLARLPNMPTGVTVRAARGKADNPKDSHPNLWLTGGRTFGKFFCSSCLTHCPPCKRRELPTAVFPRLWLTVLLVTSACNNTCLLSSRYSGREHE